LQNAWFVKKLIDRLAVGQTPSGLTWLNGKLLEQRLLDPERKYDIPAIEQSSQRHDAMAHTMYDVVALYDNEGRHEAGSGRAREPWPFRRLGGIIRSCSQSEY